MVWVMPMPTNDLWNSDRGGLRRHLQLRCDWFYGADVSHRQTVTLRQRIGNRIVPISGTSVPAATAGATTMAIGRGEPMAS